MKWTQVNTGMKTVTFVARLLKYIVVFSNVIAAWFWFVTNKRQNNKNSLKELSCVVCLFRQGIQVKGSLQRRLWRGTWGKDCIDSHSFRRTRFLQQRRQETDTSETWRGRQRLKFWRKTFSFRSFVPLVVNDLTRVDNKDETWRPRNATPSISPSSSSISDKSSTTRTSIISDKWINHRESIVFPSVFSSS